MPFNYPKNVPMRMPLTEYLMKNPTFGLTLALKLTLTTNTFIQTNPDTALNPPHPSGLEFFLNFDFGSKPILYTLNYVRVVTPRTS